MQFEQDTLRERPLWIRVIIGFIGTFVLETVAAGSGVINRYVGDTPVSRTAAVIAPGAAVMAMIYAWAPLSGLQINPAVTFGFACRLVFPRAWVVPYWAAQLAGAMAAAWFLQVVFGHVSEGGTYPISTPGGDWRIAGDGGRAHLHLGERDLQHRDREQEHRPQRGHRGRRHGGSSACSPARSAARR